MIQVNTKKAAMVVRLIKNVKRKANEKGRNLGLISIRYLKYITYPAYCVYQFGCKVVIYFPPQTFRRNINGVCVAIKVHIPNLGCYQRAWQYFSRMTDKKLE